MVSESSQGKTKTKTALKTNGNASSGAVASPGNGSTTLAPEAKVQLEQIRTKMQLSAGQIVLLMTNLPRYRSQTLADLSHLVLEPLLHDRISIATARPKDSVKGATVETLAGVAIWASVSDSVDAKIREQISGGSFPIRLGADDWASGVSIHPIVPWSVEPGLLAKLKMFGGRTV